MDRKYRIQNKLPCCYTCKWADYAEGDLFCPKEADIVAPNAICDEFVMWKETKQIITDSK